MKRIFTYFCVGLLILSHQWLAALEIEAKGGINNMGFKPEYVNQTGEFEPYPGITGNLSLRGDISKECAFSFNIERDNIFFNSADLRLKTRLDYFGFEFGVFSGLTDFPDSHHLGVLGHMEVTWPGILFFSVGGSSTIGSEKDFMSDVSRESAEAKLGFWLPYVIATLSAESKSFKWYPTHDNLTRFKLSADISFGKTTDAALRIDAGYQILSRAYMATDDKVDELSTIFAGFDFQFGIGKQLRFILGGELPFLPSTNDQLKTPEDFWLMYKAYAGIIVKLF